MRFYKKTYMKFVLICIVIALVFGGAVYYKRSRISNIKIGDTVTFGSYYIGSNTDTDNLQWQILAQKDGYSLIFNRQIIDCEPFDSNNNGTWSSCSLRLNWIPTFIKTAFTTEEIKCIKETDNGDTNDQLFLLSIDELNQYLDSEVKQRAMGTIYAESNGLEDDSNMYASYWLRDTGSTNEKAASMDSKAINRDGHIASSTTIGIRLACWVKTSALKENTED